MLLALCSSLTSSESDDDDYKSRIGTGILVIGFLGLLVSIVISVPLMYTKLKEVCARLKRFKNERNVMKNVKLNPSKLAIEA